MANGYPSNSTIPLPNAELKLQEEDCLYHFGIAKSHKEVLARLSDVKFVCIGGSVGRMRRYAELFASENPPTEMSDNLCSADRYGMWKTGQVLWVNHGMGTPSLSIMLLELFKLLHYANCSNVQIIRIGTCGGIGVEPGTVIVSSGALNGALQPKHIQYVAGKKVERDALLDPTLNTQLFDTAKRLEIPAVRGLTMCTDDFYEGQMRLDGPFCDYNKKEKLAFLDRLRDMGVKNIEMECTCLASFTHRLGIQAAIMCVALLDRLKGDQVQIAQEKYEAFETRPYQVVSHYIRERLMQNGL